MTAYFVTGTDTGVGKTLVSCALLHALARRHPRVVGMKPVAAGLVQTPDGWDSEDAIALRAASTVGVPPALDNPVRLPDPLSPHLAAERAGTRIDIPHLVACQRELAQHADAMVVEGAGGFLVPLSPEHTGADLAQALGLPVLLVVGLRLGCLNHALLSAEAIRARGLPLAGWVANRIDPGMAAADDNIAFLRQRLGAPLLADIAHSAAPDFRTVPIELP
ncbi:dethiobiotin synthase [Hydrogenophaga pseudoflava]|uniref:ATP-dependent dethiobiotin synthetase BioD n=1 Tax=Hydrogenophaga pseudoflava TaxID=47421 RepID=A0A4P6WX82_HYDPS|nr:dethiobiotin synthase [Hydrogenophaga pseudoflava]QBM27149.1 ATP-dependent dethiobiotin synthetase BioD 1 [Hydrogenophaga pseudoflava]